MHFRAEGNGESKELIHVTTAGPGYVIVHGGETISVHV
jgi:hypothetical protein